MLSKLFGKRKNGFTLIELLLACSIFAILVSGVIIAINRSYSFMNDTKLRIKATNFAREGVEVMFNIRDTNWRKHSGERDTYRLSTGTGTSNLQSGIYVIKEGKTVNDDRFFYVDKLTDINANINSFYSDDGFWGSSFSGQRESAKIQFDGDYKYMEYSDGNWSEQSGLIQDLLLSEINFYRIVRIFGIYCKTSNGSSVAVDSTHCKNTQDPKEMRFCVKVFYEDRSTKHTSELCSIMTNFTE